MSTIFNNGKRHGFYKTAYGKAPHSSKKRIRHNKEKKTEKIQYFKFNFGGLMVALIIWFFLEGNLLLKIITGIIAIACSFHCWQKEVL